MSKTVFSQLSRRAVKKNSVILGTLCCALLLSLPPVYARPDAVTAVAYAVPGQVVIATENLKVPKGTRDVKFSYIMTAGMAGLPDPPFPGLPDEAQLFYNPNIRQYRNNWAVEVFLKSNGLRLMAETGVTDSLSLFQAPILWTADFEGYEIIPVQHLTQDREITLTLVVSICANRPAEDRIWSRLKTMDPGDVEIISIKPDQLTSSKGKKHWSKYYSIPRRWDRNFFQRDFTIKIRKPPGSTVKRVRVTLRSLDADLMTVLDEGVGGEDSAVRQVGPNKLKVRVTFKDKSAPADLVPPPAHGIRYRFNVVVELAGGAEKEAERDSPVRYALWRMPDEFKCKRFGKPNDGHDDWASRSTYNWMKQNRKLVTRINDISLEHARIWGHTGHRQGTDIDMFHFDDLGLDGETVVCRVGSGRVYVELAKQVGLAFGDNPEAREKLIEWITKTRNGLDELIIQGEVQRVRYMKGKREKVNTRRSGRPKYVRLRKGWAYDLLRFGRTTTVSGIPLDLDLDVWISFKYTADNGHNAHMHIHLRE